MVSKFTALNMSQKYTNKIMTNSLIMLASCFLILNFKIAPSHATMTPEIPSNDNADSVSSDLSQLGLDEQKRNWQSLQGSWGKRTLPNSDLPNDDDDVQLSDRWMPLLSGLRPEPQLKYSLVFLTDAGTLERLAKQHQLEEQIAENNNVDEHEEKLDEKRNWKDMNAAWGKRRNGPTWNKFNGAWGKREPGWNNLKGMWGKRSGRDWQKLQSGWGKRSMQF